MHIHVEGISKSYGTVNALHPISMDIPSGEFVSLLGPSGCGKTTLLSLIAGLEVPDGGRISFGDKLIFDRVLGKNVSAEARNIGMVFQDFALWPHMSVFENVAFSLRARKLTDKLHDRVNWALQKVRLNGFEKRLPGQLSGGQQQRVSFARAIVARPDLILLDEPLSALDAILREELREELVSITKELRLTAIYVTHDQSEAMSMSDRVFVMRDGRIIQCGPPEELYGHPKNQVVADFIGKVNYFPGTASNELSFVRPERVSMTRQGIGDSTFEFVVEHALFLGDRYELILRNSESRWRAYSAQRVGVGSRLTVFVGPTDVLRFDQERGGNESNEEAEQSAYCPGARP